MAKIPTLPKFENQLRKVVEEFRSGKHLSGRNMRDEGRSLILNFTLIADSLELTYVRGILDNLYYQVVSETPPKQAVVAALLEETANSVAKLVAKAGADEEEVEDKPEPGPANEAGADEEEVDDDPTEANAGDDEIGSEPVDETGDDPDPEPAIEAGAEEEVENEPTEDDADKDKSPEETGDKPVDAEPTAEVKASKFGIGAAYANVDSASADEASKEPAEPEPAFDEDDDSDEIDPEGDDLSDTDAPPSEASAGSDEEEFYGHNQAAVFSSDPEPEPAIAADPSDNVVGFRTPSASEPTKNDDSDPGNTDAPPSEASAGAETVEPEPEPAIAADPGDDNNTNVEPDPELNEEEIKMADEDDPPEPVVAVRPAPTVMAPQPEPTVAIATEPEPEPEVKAPALAVRPAPTVMAPRPKPTAAITPMIAVAGVAAAVPSEPNPEPEPSGLPLEDDDAPAEIEEGAQASAVVASAQPSEPPVEPKEPNFFTDAADNKPLLPNGRTDPRRVARTPRPMPPPMPLAVPTPPAPALQLETPTPTPPADEPEPADPPEIVDDDDPTEEVPRGTNWGRWAAGLGAGLLIAALMLLTIGGGAGLLGWWFSGGGVEVASTAVVLCEGDNVTLHEDRTLSVLSENAGVYRQWEVKNVALHAESNRCVRTDAGHEGETIPKTCLTVAGKANGDCPVVTCRYQFTGADSGVCKTPDNDATATADTAAK